MCGEELDEATRRVAEMISSEAFAEQRAAFEAALREQTIAQTIMSCEETLTTRLPLGVRMLIG